ncbi:hypothetical protein PHET_03743 [Paragonimus heterotremus]|uniref:Uncharacterized protein n=1 Tax=Paragonimus heterotremus TaxID=100268 RepID=A0A8J4T0B9_9TREM|nr:hypothetical protein PHET_03743 [Paragonimus heterotremus]
MPLQRPQGYRLSDVVLFLGLPDGSLEHSVLQDICEVYVAAPSEIEEVVNSDILEQATDLVVFAGAGKYVVDNLSKLVRLKTLTTYQTEVVDNDLMKTRPVNKKIFFFISDVSFHLIPLLYDSNLLSEFILSLLLITENRTVRLIHPPSAMLTRPRSAPDDQPNGISKHSSPSSTTTLKFGHGIGSLLNRALWDRNADEIFCQTKAHVRSVRAPQYHPKNLTLDKHLRDRQNMTTQTGRNRSLSGKTVGILGWSSAIIGVYRCLQSFGCAILVADCDLRDGMDFLFNIHRVQSVGELISRSDWLVIIKGYDCSIEGPISSTNSSSVYDSQKVGPRLTDGLLDYVKSGCCLLYLTDERFLDQDEVNWVRMALDDKKLDTLVTNRYEFAMRNTTDYCTHPNVFIFPDCTNNLLLSLDCVRSHVTQFVRRILLTRNCNCSERVATKGNRYLEPEHTSLEKHTDGRPIFCYRKRPFFQRNPSNPFAPTHPDFKQMSTGGTESLPSPTIYRQTDPGNFISSLWDFVK